jgi:hypothetical protein
VTSLQAKTKRTRKHRALADEEAPTGRRHFPGSNRGLGAHKPTHPGRHNKTEVDTWALKGVADFTRDPTTPTTIPVNGIAVELSNSAGAILDTVAFAPNECKLAQKNRRVLCKHTGGPSRLTLTQRKVKGTSSFLPVWQLSGHFRKQDIVGDIAATPLTVAVYIDIAYVDR